MVAPRSMFHFWGKSPFDGEYRTFSGDFRWYKRMLMTMFSGYNMYVGDGPSLMDVKDEMSCWQLCSVGESFDHFGHQLSLSFSINVGHQHSKDVTNIKIQSPTSTNRHQLYVTNITVIRFVDDFVNRSTPSQTF